MRENDVDPLTSVRLTRKFAEAIDGIDLSRNQVGDRLRVSHREARMLIAEGWALPYEENQEGAETERRAPEPGDPARERSGG